MRRRPGLRAFLVAGLLVTLAVAALVSQLASSEPDGLERVAIDEGFADSADDHALADAPTADYAVEGVEDERLSTAAAGVLGLVVTGAAATGLLALARRGAHRRTAAPPAP